jgi:hypothetical protein
MLESIIVALITGGLSLIGVGLSVFASSRKTQAEYEKSQAVMNERISELTREVREHNNFARRMPVVEEQIRILSDRMAILEKSTVSRKV